MQLLQGQNLEGPLHRNGFQLISKKNQSANPKKSRNWNFRNKAYKSEKYIIQDQVLVKFKRPEMLISASDYLCSVLVLAIHMENVPDIM